MGGSIAAMLTRSASQQVPQGAPADFPGVVIPNPDNIKPMEDTEAPPPTRLSKGAAFYGGNKGNKLKMDVSNPAKNQMEPQFPYLREQ